MTKVIGTVWNVLLYGMDEAGKLYLVVGTGESFDKCTMPMLFINDGITGAYDLRGNFGDNSSFTRLEGRVHQMLELVFRGHDALLRTTYKDENGKIVTTWQYKGMRIEERQHEITWGFALDEKTGLIHQRML